MPVSFDCEVNGVFITRNWDIVLFGFLLLQDPHTWLIYEMAENGTDCDQRRVGMIKEQHNGNFTGRWKMTWCSQLYASYFHSVFSLHSFLPPEFVLYSSSACKPCKVDLGTNGGCNRTELESWTMLANTWLSKSDCPAPPFGTGKLVLGNKNLFYTGRNPVISLPVFSFSVDI